MSRNEPALHPHDLGEIPLRGLRPVAPKTRTIVIRQGTGWLSLALFCLLLLLLIVVLLGQRALAAIERRHEEQSGAVARFERKVQQLESGLGFDSRRRTLLLGMRDQILRVNARVSLADAYRYAELALVACEKYPAVDPLLLLAIGTVESRYDAQATSPAGARGLYQIWPSTGRLLLRSLGWDYDDADLYDAEKNTQAAALYLDILFTTYNDPQLVLAEYNGGPLNAGYFRAAASQLANETRNYVPQVLEVHRRLKEKFETGMPPPLESMHQDSHRDGKSLSGAARR
jgi:soluble lytic murein transglycosylase-like protein